MSVQTAGFFRDPDGVMRLHCACGHLYHREPCPFGVATGREQTEGLCGCPRTCWPCLNMRFVIEYRGEGGDDKWTRDCPRCTDGTGAA